MDDANMKKHIDVTAGIVTFTFEDGVQPYQFNLGQLSPANRDYAVGFGIGHKLGDNAATCKTEVARRAAVAEIGDYLANPDNADWTMRGPRKIPQNAAIIKLATRMGMTYEQAEAWIAEDAVADLTK